jgi:hypothetical protein
LSPSSARKIMVKAETSTCQSILMEKLYAIPRTLRSR